MDLKEDRELANRQPEQFLEKLKGNKTIIDEAQLAPDLFFALKERVRVNQKPGQFILSGSVRFTSKKAIRESLTGRIQYLELLPFSIAELEHEPLPRVVHELLDHSDFEIWAKQARFTKSSHLKKMKLIDQYLIHGGLPGVSFIRNDVMRNNKMDDQLRTLIDRDLRQIYPTKLGFDRLIDFCGAIAKREGVSIKYEEIKAETDLSAATQKSLILALESVFLIRKIPIEGGMKGFSLILEDQGESRHLTQAQLNRSIQLTSLLYRNIRTEFFYRFEKNVEFFQYRTRAGVEIPLALRSNHKALGFLPIEGEKPDHREKSAGDSFLRSYRDSKVVFFNEHSAISAINDRMVVVPLSVLV